MMRCRCGSILCCELVGARASCPPSLAQGADWKSALHLESMHFTGPRGSLCSIHAKLSTSPMDKTIRVLILEDNDNDAELTERELQKSKIDFLAKTAETRTIFLRELNS